MRLILKAYTFAATFTAIATAAHLVDSTENSLTNTTLTSRGTNLAFSIEPGPPCESEKFGVSLGTCVDFCRPSSMVEPCQHNICTESCDIINVPDGWPHIQSMAFAGDTRCVIWSGLHATGKSFRYVTSPGAWWFDAKYKLGWDP
jgi:hypothetical protein